MVRKSFDTLSVSEDIFMSVNDTTLLPRYVISETGQCPPPPHLTTVSNVCSRRYKVFFSSLM